MRLTACAAETSALVAVNQSLQTLRFIPLPNPSHLATAPAQQLAGFVVADLLLDQQRDDLATTALFLIQVIVPMLLACGHFH